MINQHHAHQASGTPRQSLVDHLVLEQVLLLVLVLVIGGLALAEAGGILDSLVHEISIVA